MVGILATDDGIRRVTFGKNNADVRRSLVQREEDRSGIALSLSDEGHPDCMIKAHAYIEDYFKDSINDNIDLPLDTKGYSGFYEKVWEVTRTIPHGEVRSYQWVARTAGSPRSARAVGQAMHANPLPLIIPCHRVVQRDGRLGGYSGGRALKVKLLEFEGIKFENERVCFS